MRYRHLHFLALAFIACGCGPSSKAQQPFVYDQRIGIANWRDDKGCLAVFNPSVAPQTKVVLVDQPTSAEPPTIAAATVGERLPQACDQGLDNRNDAGVAPSFYRVATADGTSASGIRIVILDPPAPLAVRDGRVEGDLDGDGTKETFSACTSAENVHFFAWRGLRAQAQPRWHGNYYVAYDMVPSCTDQDVAAIVALKKKGQ